MTTFLDVATTLDVYSWPLGGDFRWRWACQTTNDPSATTGTAEDVSDVTRVRMWMQARAARGEMPADPLAFTDVGGQVSLDTSDPTQAWLVVVLSDVDDGEGAPAGIYDVLIAYDRAGGAKDDVAAFVLERRQGPRPGP